MSVLNLAGELVGDDVAAALGDGRERVGGGRDSGVDGNKIIVIPVIRGV